ncbi:MAG: hypothetical protein ACOYI2_07235 [Bacillota bacterium]|jgi:hypothetical protein|nr:hypothetical protein [Clostridia bacterium]
MQNVSTKELNYIKDLLSWELLSSKKCFQYGHQESNSGHQKIFFDTADTHRLNYLNLLNYVDQVVKKQGGQIH